MKGLAAKLMYNCDQISEFIYDYVEGKVSFITRARFDMHLKACKNCRQYVYLYSTAANPVKFIEENPLPEELKEKTISFLKSEGILEEKDEE